MKIIDDLEALVKSTVKVIKADAEEKRIRDQEKPDLSGGWTKQGE